MSKYDKMLEVNHKQSVEKIQRAKLAIQEMIDAIAPRLLPVLFTGLIFYLIKVKKWTTYKLVILTIVIGVVLSLLHIIA